MGSVHDGMGGCGTGGFDGGVVGRTSVVGVVRWGRARQDANLID